MIAADCGDGRRRRRRDDRCRASPRHVVGQPIRAHGRCFRPGYAFVTRVRRWPRCGARLRGLPRDGLIESRRRDGVDIVAVVTPNDTHHEIASAFLKKGISVVCEKPLTNEATTAAALVDLAESTGAILAVPHIYSAYAMVRHAARMVRDGNSAAFGSSLPNTPRDGHRRRSNSGAWTLSEVAWPRPSPTSAPTHFTCCATSRDWKPPGRR